MVNAGKQILDNLPKIDSSSGRKPANGNMNSISEMLSANKSVLNQAYSMLAKQEEKKRMEKENE